MKPYLLSKVNINNNVNGFEVGFIVNQLQTINNRNIFILHFKILTKPSQSSHQYIFCGKDLIHHFFLHSSYPKFYIGYIQLVLLWNIKSTIVEGHDFLRSLKEKNQIDVHN